MNIEEKKSLWEQNLDKLYATVDNKDIGSLLKIIISENFGGNIGKLYNIINDDSKFSEIINQFSDKTIEFPNINDFTSSIILTMVYYYKEVMGFSWKQIQQLLPYERDINLRYGAKINTIRKKIRKRMDEMKEIKDENTENIFEI